ncbi:hypothetical protein DIPPA_09753 [Diplonema papillatum]|nr:hypothetical protein DIPPA_09753 [Diplonema papillatum]
MLRSSFRQGREALSLGAACVQRRDKGFMSTPNTKVKTSYKEGDWHNRGFNVDKRMFNHARGALGSRDRHSRFQKVGNGHLGWGPTQHNAFTDVTDMRKEIELTLGNSASLTPSALHKNAQTIVPENFDYTKVLAQRGRYQPLKGYYYDEAEYRRRWNMEELERLRGNKHHLKYYSGGFSLHSL